MRVQFDGRDVVRPLGPTIELDIIILPTAPGVCWPRHEGIGMSKLAPPNYTQIPNELLDRMGEFTPAEFKVLMAICRKTFGWHKDREVISLTQLEGVTKLSRSSVQEGIMTAIERGLLERTKFGVQSFSYHLLVASDYQFTQTTSSVAGTDLVASDAQLLVASDYTQKKELKKVKETDRSIARKAQPDVGSDRIGSVGSLNLPPGDDGGLVGSGRSVCEKLRAIGLGARQAKNVLAKWPRTLGVSVDAWGAWIACHQHGEDDIANAVAYAYGGLMAGNLPDQPDDPEELRAEERKRDEAAQAREAARFDRPPLPGAEPAPRSPPVIPIPENVVDPAEFRRAILRMREASMMPGSGRPANAYQTGGPDE